MPTIVKRVVAQKSAKPFHPVVEALLVFGLVGLLISLGIAAYGVDLSPGFF